MKNNRIAPPVNTFYSYTINITYHIVSCNLSSKQILHLSKEDSKTFVINDVSTKPLTICPAISLDQLYSNSKFYYTSLIIKTNKLNYFCSS